jgi:predicted GNAT family acetyltransferase
MTKIDLSKYTLTKSEGVFTFKNSNTTIGFVRFSDLGKVEYIFVNPMFRKQGLAKKLLKLVKNKTGKKLLLQEPISPLGNKLLKSIEKWN